MNRLTTRSNEALPVLVRGAALGPAYFMSERHYEDYRDALDRLAAYEDTGLEPEEIAKDANTPNKWISTAERQPEKSDYYLVCTAKGMHLVLNYSKKHNKWNAFDSEDEPKHALEVTHWMHLPEPPEVEK